MLVRLYTSVYIYSVWLIRIRLFFPLPGWCKSSWNVGNGIVRQHHITHRILSSLSLSLLACGDDDDEEDMNYIGLYNSLSFYFSSFSSSSCSSAFLLLYCVLCCAAVLAVVVPSRHVQNSMPSRPPSNQLASHEPNITFEKESQGIAPCSSSTAPNRTEYRQQPHNNTTTKKKVSWCFFLPSVVVVVLFPILLYNIRHILPAAFLLPPPLISISEQLLFYPASASYVMLLATLLVHAEFFFVGSPFHFAAANRWAVSSVRFFLTILTRIKKSKEIPQPSTTR